MRGGRVKRERYKRDDPGSKAKCKKKIERARRERKRERERRILSHDAAGVLL